MSRCFPYPPPGYVRNQVAEADATTKLQKEREMMEKKKEKRSDKKTVQDGENLEASKHSKRTHKKRKHEHISEAGQQARKASKESVEQLEKSGLSEEHGAPCFSRTLHDSPESSQDSSKRRKVILPSPNQTKNGNILRIKIRRDQDSPAAMLEKPSVLQQSPVEQMGSDTFLVRRQNAIQPDNNKAMVKSAAALQQSIKGDFGAAGPKQVGIQPPAKVMQRVDLRPAAKVAQRMEPQLPVKAAMGRVDPPPAKVMGRVNPPSANVMGRVDPSHAKVLQRVDPQLPSKVIQRDALPSCAKVSQKEISTAAFRQTEAPQPVLQKPKVSAELHVVKQQQMNSSFPKEEPSFSGRNTEAAPVQEAKRSKSDRKKSRKAEKKERKFRDLFVTWNPPSFEMGNMDVCDQDWLFDRTSKPDASMSGCRGSDGSLPCQPSEQQQLLLQPRAIHLPDLHVYQLPYVVPF